MVNDMAWNYGQHHFAELSRFGDQQNVRDMLRKGKDTHRMLENLLNTSQPAHAKAFAREFISEWKSSQNASMGLMPSVTEFLDWLKNDRGDITFRYGRDFWLY
jgi:hypothetical protein